MVKLFSKEIIEVNGVYVSLPLIVAINEPHTNNSEGCGSVWYSFDIECVGNTKVKINDTEEVDYSGYITSGVDKHIWKQAEYAKRQLAIDFTRQQVLKYWKEYLENK